MIINLKPQEGPQELFLSTSADIAIYGGAAGGGKSWALLVEPLRHYLNKNFNGIIFRRTTKQVRNIGGLWDESAKIYPYLGAKPKESTLEWNFTSGMRLQFAHIEYENNIYDYQGSQFPYIGFDELTHFTERQFFYLLSRNRSMSGVPGYIRATTNPDCDSWVRKFIDWWIDKTTGYAIPERSGVIRWFIRENDDFIWGDTRQELIDKYGADQLPKSVTFIKADINDNKILMEKDPSYLSNLMALSRLDRERLGKGNWNIRATAGTIFKKFWFEVVDVLPIMKSEIRAWDHASTKLKPNDKRDPDYTVGLKMDHGIDGYYYITDLIRERLTSFQVESITINTARQDGIKTKVKIFKDPGSAGDYEANAYVRLLAGFNIEVEKISTNKVAAAKPLSAQAEAGNVKVLRANWNDVFFNELENFPDGAHDDIVDALSSGYNCLMSQNVGKFSKEFINEKPVNNIGSLTW